MVVMKTIAIIGQKGGTGKTTLTQILAVAAEKDGKAVAAVDLDPQVSLCKWSDLRGEEGPVVIDAQPARLTKTLETARSQGVDFCLVDTAGRAEEASLAAVRVADLVLLPLQPTFADLSTVEAAQNIIGLAGGRPTLAVLMRVKPRGTRHTETAQFLEGQGIPVCPHVIGDRVTYQDAAGLGRTPQEFEPNGAAARESNQVYRFVVDTVNRKTNKPLKE